MSNYLTNVYVTGQFNGNYININNSANSTTYSTLYNTNSNGNTIFIGKYDNSGNYKWGKTLGDSNNISKKDIAYSVTTDSNNNVYITGGFDDSNFNIYGNIYIPSNSSYNIDLNITNEVGGTYAFLAKYDSSGDFKWVTRLGYQSSTSDVMSYFVDTDLDNNVYITGQYNNDSLTIYNTLTTSYTTENIVREIKNSSIIGITEAVETYNNYDCFIIKYDSSGNYKWGTLIGGSTTPFDNGYSLATDLNNNLYVTGPFNDVSLNIYDTTTDYNKVGIIKSKTNDYFQYEATFAGEINQDCFIIKYNSSGNYQWGTLIGGTTSTNDIGYGISTDLYNNVYVTGIYTYDFLIYNNRNFTEFTETNYNSTGYYVVVDNNSAYTNYYNNSNGFLAKYDTNGNYKWCVVFGNFNEDISNLNSYAVYLDNSSNVYVAGQVRESHSNFTKIYNSKNYLTSYFMKTYDENTSFQLNEQSYVGFLIKYNADGLYQWSSTLLSDINNPCGSDNYIYSISIDQNNYIYVAGQYASNINIYDVTTSYYMSNDKELNARSNENPSTFILKYDYNGNLIWKTKVTSNIENHVIGYGINCFSYLNKSTTTTTTTGTGTVISDICFVKNTPINTDQGTIFIQDINPNVNTIHNKKIVAVTKTITRDKYLVCFDKHSIHSNFPCEKTVMSKKHKLLYRGEMIEADSFIGKFENVHKQPYRGEYLYNVLMEDYDTIKVNNLICETLDPDNFLAKMYKTI